MALFRKTAVRLPFPITKKPLLMKNMAPSSAPQQKDARWMEGKISSLLTRIKLTGLVGGLACTTVMAQTSLPLNDLSSFDKPGPSWQIVGDAKADLAKEHILTFSAGQGILMNLPGKKKPGQDLLTTLEHGDVDLELDYLMAKGSNSGIYLQGRYEIQLLDSWGVKTPTSGDNGGIYERWDDSKPNGQKGYQGYAPRQNASKAPGLWQHIKISFRAPRFDASGKKVENAKILEIKLNGVTIHENVELFGPTRGAMGGNEVAKGPIRIQGDHGPLAIRNIKINKFDSPLPTVSDLKFAAYQGQFEDEPDYATIKPVEEGTMTKLTADVNPLKDDFLLKITGNIKIAESGDYQFNTAYTGGAGVMRINGKEVSPMGGRNGRGKVNLSAGNHPFEIVYTKSRPWESSALAVSVAGPGIREYFLTGESFSGGNQVDPILVDAPQNTILRSFMDIPGGIRVVHAVSVGSPENIHYTYDMDKGMLVQAWKGGFLNTTPMWHSRGDGSSRPVGYVQHFGKPAPTVEKLATPQQKWAADTTGTNFKPKGYVLDKNDVPTFKYLIYGAMVNDAIKVLSDGTGLQRVLTVENPTSNLYVLLTTANSIEALDNGLYLVDDKSYYLKVDGAVKPVIRDVDGHKELIAPIQNSLSYSILF